MDGVKVLIKQKTAMTSFDIAAVVYRLQQMLPMRVVNVYGIEDSILIKVKGKHVSGNLIAEPAVRFHLTSYDIVEKGIPSPLIMGFRKHLRDSIITDVKQYEFDRIIYIEFSNSRKLVVEVVPRGVIALVGNDNKIIHATEQRKMKDRVITRGTKYTPPPSRTIHPNELDARIVMEAIKHGPDLVRGLVRGIGYPGEVVEEALYRIGISPTSSPNSINLRDAEQLVEVLKSIYDESRNSGKSYMIISDEETPLSITPFNPIGLREAYQFKIKTYDDIMRGFDEYFVRVARSAIAGSILKKLKEEEQKLNRAIEKTLENIRDNEEKVKRLSKIAETLSQRINELYKIHECVNKFREQYGWPFIVGNCKNVVDVEPSRGVYKVTLGDDIVELYISEDPYDQIVGLYKRIGELQSKIERAQKILEELKKKRNELERSIRIESEKVRALIRRKEWYEKYHWLFTTNWLLAIGGRDASQNESIVKRYLNDKNIFMHAEVHGGAAVVLFTNGKTPPTQDLRDAATLAACFSKAWKTGIASVDVYWAWGSQVSKSPPSGEYLAKGAFMVYGKRNYIRGVELRLALGVNIDNDAPIVIVGPEHLVRKRALYYAILIPGEIDPSKIASRLRSVFRKMAIEDHKAYIEALSNEELRMRIPGPSRILTIRKGEAIEPPRPHK